LYIFLIKKMDKNRKTLTEKEMLYQLREGKIQLPPLSFRFLDGRRDVGVNGRFDAFIEALWRQNIARFAVECKALSTPKAFQDGVNLLKSFSLPNDYLPMLFMPFLSERQLQELEREGLSGIDLCGNGVVVVPDTFAVSALICAATVWWLYRIRLPCSVVAGRTVSPLRPLLKTFTGKTVPWWGGSFSSAPATKPFKRSVQRSTSEIPW
jgi:hypothetical protein